MTDTALGEAQNIVNKYTIRISANSNPYDNYYACSSIYLMSGFGSGQIRQIVASDGLKKTVSVNPSTGTVSATTFSGAHTGNLTGPQE